MSDWTVEDKLFAAISAAAPLVAFACAASLLSQFGASPAAGPRAYFSAVGAAYFLIMVGASTINLSSLAAQADEGERIPRSRRLVFACFAALGALCMAISILA